MERRGPGGGKEEESETAQDSRKAGKAGGSSARDTSSLGFAVFRLPCLKARGVCCDAVCKRLLAAIPELAWALTAGSLEAAPRTSAGPHRASTPSAPEGTQLCHKQRQPDCRAGWEAGCSNRAGQLRTCPYTPAGFEDPRLLPSLAAPPGSGSRFQTCSPDLNTSGCSPLTLSPVTVPQPG